MTLALDNSAEGLMVKQVRLEDLFGLMMRVEHLKTYMRLTVATCSITMLNIPALGLSGLLFLAIHRSRFFIHVQVPFLSQVVSLD